MHAMLQMQRDDNAPPLQHALIKPLHSQRRHTRPTPFHRVVALHLQAPLWTYRAPAHARRGGADLWGRGGDLMQRAARRADGAGARAGGPSHQQRLALGRQQCEVLHAHDLRRRAPHDGGGAAPRQVAIAPARSVRAQELHHVQEGTGRGSVGENGLAARGRPRHRGVAVTS